MEFLWDFLSDQENRAIIQWVAGGIAAIAAALWTLFKFFLSKGTGDAKPSQDALPKIQVITSSNRGKAAGRDINEGVSGITIFLIVLFTVAVAVLLATQFGDRIGKLLFSPVDDSLRTAYLELSCGAPNEKYPALIDAGEYDRLARFKTSLYEGAEAYVYVKVFIDRTCNACECERMAAFDPENSRPDGWELYHDYGDDENRGLLQFEQNPAPRLDGYFSDQSVVMQRGFEIWTWLSEDAFGWNIYLPRKGQLTDRQYRAGEYGAEVSFDGIFIPKVEEGTGYTVISLEPVELPDDVFAKLTCIRDGREPSFLARLLYGC